MRKVLLLLLLCVTTTAVAEDFKILFVNTGTIRIGGKDLERGDVFSDSDKIAWTDAKQAVKVLSMTSHKQYVFVSSDFNERKLKSAKDYLVKTNRLSTRGSGSLSSVGRQIGETLYVVDSTSVSINYTPDESEFFFLLSNGSRHKLEYQDGNLLFSPDIWDGAQESMTVDLYFRHSDNEEELVIEGLSIIPLPETVQAKKSRRR